MGLSSWLLLFLLNLGVSSGYHDVNKNEHWVFIDYFEFTGEGGLQLNVSNIRFSLPLNSHNLSQIGFFFIPRNSSLAFYKLEKLSCYLHSPASKTIYTLDNIQKVQPLNFNLVYPVMDDEIFSLYFQNCIPTKLNVSMSIQSSMYNIDARTGRRCYFSAHMRPLPWIYSLFLFAYVSFAFFLFKYKVTVTRHLLFLLHVVILKAISIILELVRETLISHTGCIECSTSISLMLMSRFLGVTPLIAWVILCVTGSSCNKLSFTLRRGEIALLIFLILGHAFFTIHRRILSINTHPGNDQYDEAFIYTGYSFCFSQVVLIVASIVAANFWRVAAGAHGKGYESLKTVKRFHLVSKMFTFYNTCLVLVTIVWESHFATPRALWLSVLLKESATLLWYVFIWCKFRPQASSSKVIVTDDVEKASLKALQVHLEQIMILAY
ncbi:hypothetical protein ACHQM5_004687 [Ranunculus cassubicifolius]